MSDQTTSTYFRNDDDLARALWIYRDALRDIPLTVGIALELARDMPLEMELSDPPKWCNQRKIDALLACAETSAKQLYDTVTNTIGAEDHEGEQEAQS